MPYPGLPRFGHAELIYSGAYTRIWRHPDMPGLVTKLALLQTVPRDVLRKYYSCQAAREVAGNRVLRGLGLVTPQILAHGFTLSPWQRHESVLFMQELPAHSSMRHMLRDEALPADARIELLSEAARQLARIYLAGFHYKDCHFENLLYVDAKTLIWIDTDLRRPSNARKLRRGLEASLDQLYETSRRYVRTQEWREFVTALGAALRGNERGRRLAEEVIPAYRALSTS